MPGWGRSVGGSELGVDGRHWSDREPGWDRDWHLLAMLLVRCCYWYWNGRSWIVRREWMYAATLRRVSGVSLLGTRWLKRGYRARRGT